MKYKEKVSKATILRVMVAYFHDNESKLKSLLDELKVTLPCFHEKTHQ